MTSNNRSVLIGLAALLCAGAAVAGPLVSGVRLVPRQDSRKVDIYYRLTGTNAFITLSIETNAAVAPAWSGVKIPDRFVKSVSGDVSALVSADAVNEKHIVWDARADWPDQKVDGVRALIEAWTRDNPPPYLVLDLGAAYDANATYPLRAYLSEEALPGGGLTNDLFRTDWLALRRIANGCFYMGSPTNELGKAISETASGAKERLHLVTLSHDYYVGVFEVTQGQWLRVMNTSPSANTGGTAQPPALRPVDSVTFATVRGGTWPLSDDAVDASSFIGRLRAKSGGFLFDLPTEAQWECACRAGTLTALHNGLNLTSTTQLCPNRNPIAWDAFNSTNQHHRAGMKLPNAWGLYDMIGNVCEIVRDRFTASLGYGWAIDPVGGSTETDRVRKGGGFNNQADPRSAVRYRIAFSTAVNNTGFRLALLLEGTPATAP